MDTRTKHGGPKHWGLASAAGVRTLGRIFYLFSIGFSRFFFSFLSSSNLQQKLGTKKKESILELGKNLRVFRF